MAFDCRAFFVEGWDGDFRIVRRGFGAEGYD